MRFERHPINDLDAVKSRFRAAGVPYRVRYRGPRVHTVGQIMPGGYRRTAAMARQDCLKQDATHFVIYPNI